MKAETLRGLRGWYYLMFHAQAGPGAQPTRCINQKNPREE